MSPRKSSPLAPLDVQQRYSIIEACAYLRLSRDKLYTLIRAGEIRIIREGGRVYVPGRVIAKRSA